MAFKNITISVEAYDVLKRLQKQGESFSKVILRVNRKRKVADAAGIFSEEEADEIGKGIKKLREQTTVRRWH